MAGAGLAWPRAADALARRWEGGGLPDDDAFWQDVRAAFLIPPDRIYLNNGTLGPSPRVVVEAVEEHGRRVAATFPPGVAWDDLKGGLSRLIGGDADGFVFPRNTTEAMNFVANGIELGPDDEVLTTDHEHIGGLEPWRSITARRGASLRIATLPVPATDSAELADAVWSHVSPRTRVVCVSHVTFTTGTILPVARLARRCREAGVVCAIDGAHPPGMLDLDLSALGGDFYASSPHKWLLAPQGNGLLYLAERWRTELWPTLASGGWDDRSLGAQRFNHMGTMDESRLAGLLSAIAFFEGLGMARVEARVRHLRRRLQSGLAAVPATFIASSDNEVVGSAMVAFRVDGVDSLDLQAYLSRTANVRTRVISEYGYGWMRLSTHVYNSETEVDRVLDLIHGAVRTGVQPR